MIRSQLKRFFLCSFSLLFLSLAAFQTAQAQEEFEEWKENYLNEFKKFQNEHDKEFHEMLKKEWKEFDIELSPDFYEKPKPNVIPEVEKEPETSDPEPVAEPDEEEAPKPSKEPTVEEKEEKEEPREKKKADQKLEEQINKKEQASSAALPEGGIAPSFEPNVKKAKVQTNSLTYFDIPIQYKYYAAYKTKLDRPVDKQAISDFWKHLSTKDYPSFLKQVKQVQSELSLNDYGYAQLLKDIGSQIYGQGTPEATLFTWFMLTQSDFGTRIAYNNQDVYLLIRTNPGVFRTTYFTINGSKYYGLSLDQTKSELPDKLYTYEGDYPKSKEKELNLIFNKLPTLPQQQESRTLKFSYKGKSYSFEVPVDKQIVNYFKNYPKADLDLYFNSQMEGKTADALLGSLEPLLEGKSDIEKANILLRFVQKSFKYETDQDQFNTEKKMFPMEALYYPANDCDDRSILYAYLIENLTDLEYIVLLYPGHLTPATHFPSNSPAGSEVGNPITYNGKQYYVTDPTYIGADVGMVMPDYQNMQPEEIYDL